MSLCNDCISGCRHEGTPTGKIEKIAGVETYIAFPPEGVEYAQDTAVLYLPDAAGVPSNNGQLLADDFARNGFQVYMPDYFRGDPIPLSAFNNFAAFDLAGWASRHPIDDAMTIVHGLVEHLKEKGVTKLGAVGFCYGGKAVVKLAISNTISVAVISHPSLLTVPKDFEDLAASSLAPFLINSCEIDQQLPPESQKIADDIFGDGKYAPGYKRTYWDGCRHGFAVRADLSDPKQVAAKEGSFIASIEFLKKL